MNARHSGWRAFSAGTAPAGQVHPLALRVLEEVGIRHSGESKGVEALQREDFDVVVTVCDEAEEQCAAWLGKGRKLHRSFRDPAKAQGSEEEQLAVFRRVRDEILASQPELLAEARKGTAGSPALGDQAGKIGLPAAPLAGRKASSAPPRCGLSLEAGVVPSMSSPQGLLRAGRALRPGRVEQASDGNEQQHQHPHEQARANGQGPACRRFQADLPHFLVNPLSLHPSHIVNVPGVVVHGGLLSVRCSERIFPQAR